MLQPESAEGFVPTLNRMGFMTTGLDRISKAFVDYCAKSDLPCLEIGAAYGVASLEALERGASIIANDLDPRHLEILKKKANTEQRARLTTLPGQFPDEIELPNDSVGSALICRVLHFFDGRTIRRSFKNLHRWLRSGGRIFVVAETPYVKTMRGLIPSYEERLLVGAEWPGYFENIHEIAPDLSSVLPPRMHFLDETILMRELRAAGFEVVEVSKLERSDFPGWLQLDGRESVGAIGEKS